MNLKEPITSCCIENIPDQLTADWFIGILSALGSDKDFFISFALVNKKISRGSISIAPDHLDAIKSEIPSFNYKEWSIDQFCRLALMLHLDKVKNYKSINMLLSTADTREQISLYKSIPFLENAQDFLEPVINGIRTNITDTYDSIALNNPYPEIFFGESAWNQMVLKGIFMERPIYQIIGLDKRKNIKLAHILHDYAKELWSASRRVTPELWRLLSGYLTEALFEDIKEMLEKDSDESIAAFSLMIMESDISTAKEWLRNLKLTSVNWSWDQIGYQFWTSNKLTTSN